MNRIVSNKYRALTKRKTH